MLDRRGFLRLSATTAGAAVVGPTLPARARRLVAGAGPVQTTAALVDPVDFVTPLDLGFNQFGGNQGALNKDGRPYGALDLYAPAGSRPALRFAWSFGDGDLEAFTGLYLSLFGLTETRTTFDGRNVVSLGFPEHSLDLDRIDGILSEPGGPRAVRAVRATVTYVGAAPLALRFELKDVGDPPGIRYWRLPLMPSPDPQTVVWDFRSSFRIAGRDLDLHRAKVLAMVVERSNVGDGVRNPDQGELRFARIDLDLDRSEAMPPSIEEMFDVEERRAVQYFLDWSSRKPASFGIPQDRSTFGDLLTTGGVGFALPAYAIAAHRGWITRGDAVARALPVLRLLGDATLFGPGSTGRVGYRGFFYHFLGVDGRRKRNFDFASTPTDESLDVVELSTIDTALALMGVLAAQSYFGGVSADEAEIRRLSQEIFDRVDWPFMLAPSQQFYLGWLPDEPRQGPPFEIDDAEGLGAYSGTPAAPSTLDFYTDEAFLVTLLAVGSTTHRVPAAVHCAWKRVDYGDGLIRTFPGSAFTYQFLHAFVDSRTLDLPACPGEAPFRPYDNSSQALVALYRHVFAERSRFTSYGAGGWGISACEGPDDRYRAYGVPPIALQPRPPEDGTVTYYGMLSSVTFGSDLRGLAARAMQLAWSRGHMHPRFGLPDAFHDEIGEAGLDPADRLLRRQGPWVQRALFAIDQGPMALALENARSGFVWDLLGANPNIQRAVARLRQGRC